MNDETTLASLVNKSSTQGNPIDVLRLFLEREKKLETGKLTQEMRFVGYVLELGYDAAKIITSDPYKVAVGGIPRGSYLIMTPTNSGNLPLHFSLLRVAGVSPTPLSSQVQQTYFELHKKSMPELDVWTQSELQWGALDCEVLGMFYADPEDTKKVTFSGDVNNVVSAHRYKVYAPDEALLKLIVNGTVTPEQQFQLGALRTMECKLSSATTPKIPVLISMRDFKGFRTAMFGKTRLGKSNVVKLLAQGMLEATKKDNSVGQLIFDLNGEYANDNPQDGNKSIRSMYEDRCTVYALTPRPATPSKPLRLNFYEQPSSCIEVLGSMLAQDGRNANYVRSFASVSLPTIESVAALPDGGDKIRSIRKIQMYWAILNKAGFASDEGRLRRKGLVSRNTKHFDPHFSKAIRDAAYQAIKQRNAPSDPNGLHQLQEELEVLIDHHRQNGPLTSSSGDPLFDADDLALLQFLHPTTGSGPSVLQAYRRYHSPQADDIATEIVSELNQGRTVILDLGNATDQVRRYFSDMLSQAVFTNQEEKFVTNKLGSHFVQLYFEEAHNLFPPDSRDLTGIYARFAKEGAKFHIGMVYSTQSPSTINRELLAQTENFFVGHLSSQDETRSLARVQIAFSGIEQDITRSRTPGYMRMLTLSHRFTIAVQAAKFGEARAQQ